MLTAVCLCCLLLLQSCSISPSVAATSEPVRLEQADIHFTVFPNDSVIDLLVFGKDGMPIIPLYEIDVHANCYTIIQDSLLYKGWDTLLQPRFWQEVMRLGKDSALVNIARSRLVIDRIALRDWNRLSDSAQTYYKDSMRTLYALDDTETIYLTTGKRHYYDFANAIP
ncbi:MAG: hypothetical protein AAF206_06660, partial [Bacteroidota bacterium]